MFWTEDEKVEKKVFSTQVSDVSIQLFCKQLPGDHIYQLASALVNILPWLNKDPRIAIQQIYIPASGNGWQRYEHSTENLLHLSKRSRLKIRLPFEYIDKLHELTGKEIVVAGYSVKFGNIKISKIAASETLISRFVYFSDTNDNEDQLLSIVYQQFKQKNILVKKMLCGKTARFNFNNETILTRSLMLADLGIGDSIKIQESGIGNYYLYGCGVFIPQKGIKAVNKNN